jgi:malate synthase
MSKQDEKWKTQNQFEIIIEINRRQTVFVNAGFNKVGRDSIK